LAPNIFCLAVIAAYMYRFGARWILWVLSLRYTRSLPQQLQVLNDDGLVDAPAAQVAGMQAVAGDRSLDLRQWIAPQEILKTRDGGFVTLVVPGS